MRKYFNLTIFLFLFLLHSCSDKKVELPKIEVEGISEIYNHSSIWIFFELHNNDTLAVLNKNNKILNTDWIFNIDKRLPMKKIVPFLRQMQKDKNKDSMHKIEGMLNYFSYADMSNDKISLVKFNPTNYITSEKDYQKIFKNRLNKKMIEINFNLNQLFMEGEKIGWNSLSQKLHEVHSNDTLNKFLLILKYNENTTYQNYLKTKAFINNAEIQIDSTEYIYKLK